MCPASRDGFKFDTIEIRPRQRTGSEKNNCVNANKPEKRTKAKNAAKQGNAGERPDAAARYTVKSSGVNSLLFILHRYLPADKLRELEGGTLEVC